MKLLKLYSWFAGSVSDFTNRFKDNEVLYKQAKTFVGKLESNSMIIFLMIPTTMTRPDIIGTDLFSLLVRSLYVMDTPDNLFPSFHVLESYMLLRTLPLLKKAPKWYRMLTPIVSPLVIISILFVKQHLIVDILGGIAVCEFGLLTMNIIYAAVANSPRKDIIISKLKKAASLYPAQN